jgi:hypothetical protein
MSVRTFIEKRCLECHDAGTARAGFRIDLLTDDFAAGNNAGLWKEVMDRINTGEMPPKKKPRPEAKEIAPVTVWIADRLEETTRLAQGAGGRVPLRRLNRAEYANTVRDLLLLDENFARRIEKELPADGKVGGFDRGAAGLLMDEAQLAQYIAVADMVLDQGVFSEKPKVSHFTWDARREKWVYRIGAAYRDETGKLIDNNPTPEFVAALKEPLAMIGVDGFQQANPKELRYVPHGPFYWTLKNDGIEYLSGMPSYTRPNFCVPFHTNFAVKGVTQDGWYRFRVKAGAFAGAGQEALKEVRLIFQYAYGSPIEVTKTLPIDAPLDAPKDYEFLVYLQTGQPGFARRWRIGWDNGGKDVVIVNPAYWDVQWQPRIEASRIAVAIRNKKPAEEIAILQKQAEAAHLAALESRKTFPGPYWVFDPKLDIAKRPRLWLGQMEWEGPLVDWPPAGRKLLFPAGEERDMTGMCARSSRNSCPAPIAGPLRGKSWTAWCSGR